LLLSITAAYAADSPQFRGPDRDGKFPGTGLLKAWPESGPNMAWEATDVGDGYASVTVVGDKVYVPGMTEDEDGFVYVLNTDGSHDRKIAYGREVPDKQAPGSRSTVTIEGDRLYIMSGYGVLSAIDLSTDKPVWQVNMLERFEGTDLRWGVAESVLIDGPRVICTPGGKDASVVALDKATGDTVWQTKGLSDEASYCTPDVIEHGGTRLILTETATLVVGIEAETGTVLWTHDHPTKYDIHGVTPVYADGKIYYSGGYKAGGGVLALSADGKSVTPVWSDKNLDCQHHGVIEHEGYLYGTAHMASREMMCLSLETGEVVWRTGDVSQSAVVFADGMLYLYEGPKKGIVHLVEATPEGFVHAGQFPITGGNSKHWAHPTIADGRLYIRRGQSVFAYDIKA
jgi:outer membrane protein assembly factor BamB